MFDILGVIRLLDRRYLLIKLDLNLKSFDRIKKDLLWNTIIIARCRMPLLSFATVHGQFNSVPRLQIESLISVEQPLDPILTSRYIIKTFYRITKYVSIYRDTFGRLIPNGINPKYHGCSGLIIDLVTRFFFTIAS